MIIGITTRMIVEDGTKKAFVNEDYITLLKRYGLTPLILPYNIEEEKLLQLCDGFLIPGGDDIDASYYFKENSKEGTLVDPRVDKFDFKVLEYAFNSHKPVLGICRGLQLINVYLHGDLITHIEDDAHKNKLDAILNIELNHTLNLKSDHYVINSFHHQKIDHLGETLVVEGTSEGAIELITSNRYPLIATQFHIEQMDGDLVKAIMNYFIELL